MFVSLSVLYCLCSHSNDVKPLNYRLRLLFSLDICILLPTSNLIEYTSFNFFDVVKVRILVPNELHTVLNVASRMMIEVERTRMRKD